MQSEETVFFERSIECFEKLTFVAELFYSVPTPSFQCWKKLAVCESMFCILP